MVRCNIGFWARQVGKFRSSVWGLGTLGDSGAKLKSEWQWQQFGGLMSLPQTSLTPQTPTATHQGEVKSCWARLCEELGKKFSLPQRSVTGHAGTVIPYPTLRLSMSSPVAMQAFIGSGPTKLTFTSATSVNRPMLRLMFSLRLLSASRKKVKSEPTGFQPTLWKP